jgi:broad specificity phosphatase PhoE
MERKLILVKHSLVTIDKDTPRGDWSLCAEGRHRCALLSERLQPYAPSAIISSPEARAQENARLVAAHFQLPLTVRDGLQEIDRRGFPVLHAAMFRKRMMAFFHQRQHRLMGLESADESVRRFNATIEQLVLEHPEGNLVVVTHGAIMSLFIALYNAVDPFSYWTKLGLPSMAILSLPDYHLLETVPTIK